MEMNKEKEIKKLLEEGYDVVTIEVWNSKASGSSSSAVKRVLLVSGIPEDTRTVSKIRDALNG